MDQIIELTVQEHYKSLVCWAIVRKSFEIIFFLFMRTVIWFGMLHTEGWGNNMLNVFCVYFSLGSVCPSSGAWLQREVLNQSAVLRWGGSPVCTDCECECGQPAWAKAQRLLQLLKCKRYDVYDWVKKWYYILWWVRVFELFLNTFILCNSLYPWHVTWSAKAFGAREGESLNYCRWPGLINFFVN